MRKIITRNYLIMSTCMQTQPARCLEIHSKYIKVVAYIANHAQFKSTKNDSFSKRNDNKSEIIVMNLTALHECPWDSSKTSDPSIFRNRADPLPLVADLLLSGCFVSSSITDFSKLGSISLGGGPHWSAELSGNLNSVSCNKQPKSI